MSETILEVEDLKTWFLTTRGVIKAVDGLSFTLKKGQILGIVGESGSGKSVTSLSILRLLPQPAGRIMGGRILYRGEDLVLKSQKDMRRYRGNHLFMISQNPMTSLNPVYTIKNQLAEALKNGPRPGRAGLTRAIIDMLKQVHIRDSENRFNFYPHQFSGGMRQRVMIAMALASRPEILIADEPTTALDVTIQAQILNLMLEVRRTYDMSIIMITHDLGVVANFCEYVLVMYAGKMFERADVRTLFREHRHPYTRGLIKSLPQLGRKQPRLPAIKGQPPDMLFLGDGCPFEPRCEYATARCAERFPEAEQVGPDHAVACWNWRDVS